LKKDKFTFPRQLVGIAVIFAVIIVAFIVGRMLFVPASFGKYGHYRADAVDEIASRSIRYAGYGACTTCHSSIYQSLANSNHKSISCESCHGPAARHVTSPGEVKPMVPRDREHCLLCHDFNPTRPTGFPQVIAKNHNPGLQCIVCHKPHNPLLPQAISECSACHRTIVSQKSVSHHASLKCTTCHQVTEKHMKNPRLERAQKPTERKFCGQCHAEGAKIPANIPQNIPRIDINKHGGRYLCWDCHYPHYPEARK
jgi:hypothetical protein